jgi:hypothetical protein
MTDDDIKRVLLEILRIGLLRVRSAAWEGRSAECAVEADHLHNIPRLVQSLNPVLLRYYLTAERPAFAKIAPRADEFASLWEELEWLSKKAGA